MRRIKLVVSDFHLGFGRLMPDGMVNDLEDFVSDHAFVDLLEYYRTDSFADAEVEVILNGDIFEGLSTVDPQDGEPELISSEKSVFKIEQIVSGHTAFFAALAAFAEAPHRQVTFLVGNHDQDLLWPDVQALLKQRVHAAIRFFSGSYRFDGVHIEHGHQYELQNRFDREQLFLSRGFATPVLKLPWGSDMFISCLLRFKRMRPYVNRVRPLRLAFFWTMRHDFRVLVVAIWAFAAALWRARFRRQPEHRITFTETLRIFFSRGPYRSLEAAAKRLLAARGIHTVVFGHTHVAMWRQLLPGKTYVNSGAWIPTTNLHLAALGRSLMQTFVYIEYENEVPRARLKLWHGRHQVEEDVVL